jgi:hypothetical protein
MSDNTPKFQSMSFGSIMDGSFRIFSQNFVELVKVALICNLPVLLIQLSANFLATSALDPAIVFVLGLAAFLVSVLSASLLAGAMTKLVSNLYLNREATAMDSIKGTLSKLGSIISAQFQVGLWVMLGFILLIVPGIIWMFSLLLVIPAVILEGKSGTESLARSKELTKYNRGRVVGVVFAMGFLMLLVTIAVGAVWGMVMGATGMDLNGIVAVTGQSLIGYILQPLSSIALVLVYYDLRITHEGFDLEMLSSELGSTEGN